MKKVQIILTVAGMFAFGSVFSQCKSFVKNNVRDAMGEYIPGENFNAAKLSPGDIAELKMTFYQGEKYRILVTNHPILDSVEFQLSDARGNVLFDNTANQRTDHFDFSVAGTQELTVNLKVPDTPITTIVPQGCVAILVGRKLVQ